jgi:tight adherence protein B
VPRWVLGFLGKRRTNKFTRSSPTEWTSSSAASGPDLPVHDCLKIIARETPEPWAANSAGWLRTSAWGCRSIRRSTRLRTRHADRGVRFFSIVMNIQQKTGGNLAEALNNLSTVLRARKLMREKVKALSAEATSSAMIIGCLPPGVVILISVWTPSYMVPMFADHRGSPHATAVGIWMSLGIFVMVRMINFKF